MLTLIKAIHYQQDIEVYQATNCTIQSIQPQINDNFYNNYNEYYSTLTIKFQPLMQDNEIENINQQSILQSNDNNILNNINDNNNNFQTGIACQSNFFNTTLIDSWVYYQSTPYKYYEIENQNNNNQNQENNNNQQNNFKLPSWSCLENIENIQLNNEQQQTCYYGKLPNGQYFVRFSQFINFDTDFDHALPYYGLSMLFYGTQMFIISYIFEKIDPDTIYQSLILRKKKIYLKNLDSYVVLTSMSRKKISLAKIVEVVAEKFGLKTDQVIFYQKSLKRRNCKKWCIKLLTSQERILYSLKGSVATLSKLKNFRKDILINEIFQDFIVPKMRVENLEDAKNIVNFVNKHDSSNKNYSYTTYTETQSFFKKNESYNSEDELDEEFDDEENELFVNKIDNYLVQIDQIVSNFDSSNYLRSISKKKIDKEQFYNN